MAFYMTQFGYTSLVPLPSPPPPRSRGLEARPSTPAIRPHRSARPAAARAVGVGQAEPRRMGPPDQEGLRGGPPKRQLAAKRTAGAP